MSWSELLPKSNAIRKALRGAFPISLLVVIFGFLFSQLLSTHMLARKADGLYSGGSTWGDLAWHLSMLSNFAERGIAAVKENPIYPGTKLSYPFLPDLLSAWLVRCGLSLQTSLVLPAWLALVGSVIALYFLARNVGASVPGAMVTPFLLFLNGGLAGYYYLWRGRQILAHLSLSQFLLRSDCSHSPEHNLRFSNFITDFVLPQRAADFGAFFGIVVVVFLWLYWRDGSRKNLLYAGLLLSSTPLIHFHSFVALGIAAGFLFVTQLLRELRNWRAAIEAWLWFAVSIAVIALPQVVWISPVDAGHFMRLQFGWMKGSEPVLWFWFKNLTPHLFVFAVAYWWAPPKLKRFYLAFVCLFVVTNVIVFQPYDFDNLKLMFWWFVMSCVVTGLWLGERWRRKTPGGIAVTVVVVAMMIATGSLAVWRELHLSWRMFSAEDLALAHYVREQTPPDAIFLTSDKHNNPVSCLGGRRILMGYRGWLWTHGIDYGQRSFDVRDMFQGSTRAAALLQQYHVNYVLLEADKAAEWGESRKFYTDQFPIVFESANYTLVRIAR